MAQCPQCSSTNVVVTEEVYTRKGNAYYRFWQFIIVVAMVLLGGAIENYGLGILLAIGGSILVGVFALINSGKKATSGTKLFCLVCKVKTYL